MTPLNPNITSTHESFSYPILSLLFQPCHYSQVAFLPKEEILHTQTHTHTPKNKKIKNKSLNTHIWRQAVQTEHSF